MLLAARLWPRLTPLWSAELPSVPCATRITVCRPIASSSNRVMAFSASSFKAPSRLLSSEPNWEPPFIYGTAWKKEKTKDLVKQAVQKGFRKIDTAAQPRHYQEAFVGDGLREVYASNIVKREDVYLQTKYTTPAGHDLNNMPYDPSAPLETQIHTSVASSLKNLRPKDDSDEGCYVDCLLLHSPLPTVDQTIQAWKILESYVPHKIRTLGISNVPLPVLRAIYEKCSVKPSVVQNRFYPQTGYDVALRAFCATHSIMYQSFWTLTGNPRLFKSEPVAAIAKSAEVSSAVALYALVMDQGIVVLNGTTSAGHMEDDRSGTLKVRDWALSNQIEWARIGGAFRRLVGP